MPWELCQPLIDVPQMMPSGSFTFLNCSICLVLLSRSGQLSALFCNFLRLACNRPISRFVFQTFLIFLALDLDAFQLVPNLAILRAACSLSSFNSTSSVRRLATLALRNPVQVVPSLPMRSSFSTMLCLNLAFAACLLPGRTGRNHLLRIGGCCHRLHHKAAGE